MDLRKLQAQIQEHAQAAYALLPETLVPTSRISHLITSESLERKLEENFQRGKWQDVLTGISVLVEKGTLSSELAHELLQARSLMELHEAFVSNELMSRTSDEDKKIIGECIRAISHGRFIKHDGALEGITGLEREEWMRIADVWPNVADAKLAVNVGSYALSNILGYPHRREHDWSDYISVPYERVDEISRNWRKLNKQISDF